jgi:alpha-tubulin suppressor-like RCC1 family protein
MLRTIASFLCAGLVVAGVADGGRSRGGSVIAWGCHNGMGHVDSDLGQCRVPASARSGVIAIAAGIYQSLALKNDGSVLACGCGGGYDYGECRVHASAGSSVIAVAAGTYHSLALKKDGSVVAWGCGRGYDFGECRVPASARSGVIAISAGDEQSLALKKDGSVVAWGCGGLGGLNYGQCRVPLRPEAA